MRRTDQVFLLTLIDFFIQIIFLGVFLYAIYSLDSMKQSKAIERLLRHFGVSDFVQLTDKLTRLVPSDLVSSSENVPPKPPETIPDPPKVKPGAGKPHCLYDPTDPHRQKVKFLAEVRADDETITFIETTDELDVLLDLLGYDFSTIESLPLATFRKYFDKVKTVKPDCRYTLRIDERTRYIEPRDAIEAIFYKHLKK